MFEQPSEFNKRGLEFPPEEKEAALDSILKAMDSDQISLNILLKHKEAELRVRKRMQSEVLNSVDSEEVQEWEKFTQDLKSRVRGDA